MTPARDPADGELAPPPATLPPDEDRPSGAPASRGRLWRRFWPLALLLIAALAVYGSGAHRYLDLDALRDHRASLHLLVERHWLAAMALYLAIYVVWVVLSVPGAIIPTMTGGFLFGWLIGALAAATGATIGAILIFLIARSAIAPFLHRRAGPWLKKVEQGFQENGWSYVIVIRLLPVIPFFIANLALSFVGLRLSVYCIGTMVGILPATFVYASFGAGLGEIFDAGAEVSLHSILTPQIVAGLFGLALLAMLPVAIKEQRRRRQRKSKP